MPTFRAHIAFFRVLLVVVACIPCGTQYLDGHKNNTQENRQSKDLLELMVKAPRFKNNATTPVLVFFVIVVAMVSSISNSLIMHVIRINPHMRTTTNYLIANMAFGDLLATLIYSPSAVYNLLFGREWSEGAFGWITCKAQYFLLYFSMYCSIFSLVAIAFDRFLAVSRPLTHKYCSWWTKYIIPLVWVVSLVIPYVLAFHRIKLEKYDILDSNKTYCPPAEAEENCFTFTSIGFFLPFVVMGILYSMIAHKLWTRRVPGDQGDGAQRPNVVQQTAKKVTRMIVSVLLAFEFCWAPKYISWIILYFQPRVYHIIDYYLFVEIAGIIMISNGLLNALIYAAFNQNYRQAFKSALGTRRLCGWCRKGENGDAKEKPSNHDQGTEVTNSTLAMTNFGVEPETTEVKGESMTTAPPLMPNEDQSK